nr:MAG: hemolysin [Bacteriophage sp.]
MTKDELKDNVVRTIFYLNSDISVKDKELLIKLLNSIVDYTNNTELEQKVKVIEQKHNELVDTVNELKAKVETYSDKINELEERVHQLENASQS